jgi:hypothetical protein
MMILSYLLGQKFFPVKYNVTKFAGYTGLSIVLYAASLVIKPEIEVIRIASHTLLLLIFVGGVLLAEKPQLKAILK